MCPLSPGLSRPIFSPSHACRETSVLSRCIWDPTWGRGHPGAGPSDWALGTRVMHCLCLCCSPDEKTLMVHRCDLLPVFPPSDPSPAWGRVSAGQLCVTAAAFRPSTGLLARVPDPQAPQKADPLAIQTSLPKIVLYSSGSKRSLSGIFLALCCTNVRRTETAGALKAAGAHSQQARPIPPTPHPAAPGMAPPPAGLPQAARRQGS